MSPATSYDFEVRTKSSAKSLSSELSATVSTDCKELYVVCNERSARQTVTMIEFGDGNHFVNRDIQPGTYVIGSNADAAACEWGRHVHIRASDAGFATYGCGIWTKQ